MSAVLEDQFIRCFKFDHQEKNLCVGTRNGLRNIKFSNPLELRCQAKLYGVEVYLLELMPGTNVIAYVTDEERNRLCFCNFRGELYVHEPMYYARPIVRVKGSKERVMVVVEDTIFIYNNIENLKLINEISLSGIISETIVDLSEHPVNSYVAYPKFDKVGHFILDDSGAPSNNKNKIIQAHDSPLVAITFDPNGRTVASASEHGILIKVHRAFNGECVYEFKRGVTLNITITSLSFSKDAKFLCANDTTNNLKIYKLDYSASIVNTGSSWFRERFQSLAESILPENASKLLFDENPFARAKLPESSACKSMCTIYRDEKGISHLLVVNTDGLVYTYSMDAANGGQCELLKSFSIAANRYVENAADTWVMV
ncbi:WD repeat domain phosphoinositide-interacting protein 1 [Tetranychus urticae]|uniref:WD repeat domain phosphoinositide-interacting protein 2 n=1 Tax=Tetranychus urticae TaxID=32264 RepID=T1KHM8_TETUR|nr:WD repeat domain phosphoinositide-interacting protein 1 [Tetranychus urticae]XP_015787002.1 WD repeat domain phosphoinositide-interacting protein 1 [Tetranychus urticae]